jgi:hypothetical protein
MVWGGWIELSQPAMLAVRFMCKTRCKCKSTQLVRPTFWSPVLSRQATSNLEKAIENRLHTPHFPGLQVSDSFVVIISQAI